MSESDIKTSVNDTNDVQIEFNTGGTKLPSVVIPSNDALKFAQFILKACSEIDNCDYYIMVNQEYLPRLSIT